MENCIFCKIIKGDIPSYKVYEDDLFYGFLDIRPLNKGNALLIPKKHYRWVDDVKETGKYWKAAHKISTASKKVLGSITTSYLTLGFEVEHAHIRIIPRFEGDSHNDERGIDLTKIVDISDNEMKEIAKAILKETQKP